MCGLIAVAVDGIGFQIIGNNQQYISDCGSGREYESKKEKMQ